MTHRHQPLFVLIRQFTAAAQFLHSTARQSTALLWWMGAIFCGLLLTGMAYQLHDNYEMARSQAEEHSTDTAFQVAEWVAGSFPAAEMLLNDVIGHVDPAELVYPPTDPALYRQRGEMLREKLLTLPKGNVIGFFDQNCVNTHSATTERLNLSNGRDFSQRDYCALARQQSPGMKVDNLMHSVINDDLQVMAVKRLPDPNNEFVGFAAVSLRLGFFRKWLERLHLQAGGEVMIVDANRRLIAVSPAAPNRLGEVIQNELLESLLDAGQGESSRQLVSPLDGVERIYSGEKLKDLPFVVLAGVSVEAALDDVWSKAQVFALGAAVFLFLTFWVIWLSVQRQRHALDLEHLASTDVLTGISNRRKLLDELETEFLRTQRLHHGFAVLMLDIDKFKAVNDTHGHAAGDVVIQRVAAISARLIRHVDSIGRWGGEEFVVLLREQTLGDALLIAERIRQAIADAPVQVSPDSTLPVTCSVGVAVLNATDASVQSVVDRADQALYQAKNAGRNRVAHLD